MEVTSHRLQMQVIQHVLRGFSGLERRKTSLTCCSCCCSFIALPAIKTTTLLPKLCCKAPFFFWSHFKKIKLSFWNAMKYCHFGNWPKSTLENCMRTKRLNYFSNRCKWQFSSNKRLWFSFHYAATLPNRLTIESHKLTFIHAWHVLIFVKRLCTK